MYFQKYNQIFSKLVESSEATLHDKTLDTDAWLTSLAELTKRTQTAKGRFFFVGNGASAAFASHMSLDWSKNGGVPCVPLFDLSHLTALGNDLGYDEIFSTQIGWHGSENDVLVAVSSSGNSPNVVKAIEVAQGLGMKVVTFTGLNFDNKSRQMGDLNIYVPAKTYGMVECAHQLLLHMWLDYTMGIEEWDRNTIQNMNGEEFVL